MLKKLIIDTDTGVDDAMAILMALEAHKRGVVEVLAITAVNGNCSEADAQRNILRTLDAAGCPDIPVYRGAKEALVVAYDHKEFYHGSDGFNDVVFSDSPDKSRIKDELAWEAMSRITKQFPGEVTIVAIGPLTNVAIGMNADPGLASRLRSLYIMGGNYEGIGNVSECAEFNFHADPEAAHAVLRLTRCPTTIASWELSYKYNHVPLSWRKEVLGKMTTKAANLVNALEEVWFRNWPWGENWILCDQLAMVAAITDDKAVVKSSPHVATVELGGTLTRGMMVVDQRVGTILDESTRRNVTIIEKLDTEILQSCLLRAFQLDG